MDVLAIVAVLVALIGWVGTVVPAVPGPLLIFGAALGYGAATGFEVLGASQLWTLGILAAGAEGLGYAVTAAGARRYGATRLGMVGAFVGLVAGILSLGPVGVLVGPLGGAIMGEAISGRTWDEAFRAGVGAVLGGIGGTLLRVALGGVMLFLFIRTVFF